jgi:hypothetical protein
MKLIKRTTTVLFVSLLLLAGCSGSSAESDPLFPTHDLEPEDSQTALVGELVLSGECLRIRSRDDGSDYLPLWPRGYSAERSEEKVSVRDPSGRTVGRTGAGIYAGGREHREVSHLLDPAVSERVHSRCPGPYWVVSEDVTIYVTGASVARVATEPHLDR